MAGKLVQGKTLLVREIDKLVSMGEAEGAEEILRIEEQLEIKPSELNMLTNKF